MTTKKQALITVIILLVIGNILVGSYVFIIRDSTGLSSVILGSEQSAPEPDRDGDGLSDRQERIFGTNSYVADSDFDGLNDPEEINIGTNPMVYDNFEDIDGDGLYNAQEAYYKTNPRAKDTDGDGVYDPDEIAQGTDPRKSPEQTPEFDGEFIIEDN